MKSDMMKNWRIHFIDAIIRIYILNFYQRARSTGNIVHTHWLKNYFDELSRDCYKSKA